MIEHRSEGDVERVDNLTKREHHFEEWIITSVVHYILHQRFRL